MVKAIVLFVVAGVLFYAGIGEFVGWLRRRNRLQRVTAVIVGVHEPAAVDPGNLSRAPIYRFTTVDGRTVDSYSSAWTYPVPEVGKHVAIAYDPADPQGTAEREGLQTVKALVFSPLLVVVGVVLSGIGLSYL